VRQSILEAATPSARHLQLAAGDIQIEKRSNRPDPRNTIQKTSLGGSSSMHSNPLLTIDNHSRTVGS
jgi:hypothetical protein